MKPRKDYRLKVDLPIMCKLFDNQQPVIKEWRTHDLSDSGMCFYATTLFKEGHVLQVNIPHIFNLPKDSIIRWCAQQSKGVYKIGVLFSNYS